MTKVPPAFCCSQQKVVCRLVHCTLRRRADTVDTDSSERTEYLLLQRGLAPPVLLVRVGDVIVRPLWVHKW